ncbi:uncharacterized protein [Fopius arisanus]|uniref:Med23 protein n=1 Tax=Fopius arisanus TaxID=64838 RepID=A0A0C9RG97_9HYME|nr:PREDICTED: uncharacterized protein LOC105270088 [Fopius arisanus]
MPAASSIYWDSVDSQRSSGSSADAGSSRQYVDPWDLENYAYLRRHSVSSSPQMYQPPRTTCSRFTTRKAEPEPEYWYSSREPIREPGYHAPASVEELYFGPPRQTQSYYQPIYEEENPRYAAPVYAPLSDLDYGRHPEDQRTKEVTRRRKPSRVTTPARGDCVYHSSSSVQRRDPVEEAVPQVTRSQEECYVDVIPPTKLGLNTYGYLKIDYDNSWNALQRKMSK